MIKENDIYLGMEVKAAKTPFNMFVCGRVGVVIYLILDLFSKSPFRSFPPRFRKLCLIGAAALCWAI